MRLRFRKTLRPLALLAYAAAALSVCLLVIAMWQPLLLQRLSIRDGIATTTLSRGELTVYRDGNIAGVSDSVSWCKYPGSNRPLRWLPTCSIAQRGKTLSFNLPMWIPTLLTLGAAIFLRTLTRPRRSGTCSRCDYDLSGLPPSAACPECGRVPQAS